MPEDSTKRLAFALAVGLLLLLTSVPLASHAAAAAPTTTSGIIIPLYSYPDSAWNTVIQQKEANPSVPMTVIIDPSNGPGSTYSSTYNSWIVKLRDAGITVLGYVFTSFAARGAASVETDIAAYKQMYWVNGIFLDEMSNVPSHEPYYSTLTAYAHSEGFPLVVGNPGTSVPSSYLGTVDVILTFESPSIPSISTLAAYTAGQSKSGFAVVSYSVSSISMSSVSLLANYAAYIYVTDGSMPAPYSGLPSYFAALVSDLRTFISSTTSLTVQSVDSNGKPLTGLWTAISSNGAVVEEGYTPLAFQGTTGAQYTVSVSNYGSAHFTHWQDGTTSAWKTVTLSKATALTASFSTSLPITVQSVTSSGASVAGMNAYIVYQGNMVDNGFTTMTYAGIPGATYTVCVNNYQNLVFSHWGDGSTTACKTFVLSQVTQLTATYNT